MGKDWDKNFDKRAGTIKPTVGKDEWVRLYVGTGLSQYAAGFKYQAWTFDWATAALRVLKPGGLMFVMGHPRTFHRLACGVEDAGFEIIDVIQWVYWTGFPKAYDIGKGFDKQAGKKSKVVGDNPNHRVRTNPLKDMLHLSDGKVKVPVTELGQQWNGWKSAKGLKPAHEPILLAQKPKSEKTICKNVERWGVGGINVNATRIPTVDVVKFDRKKIGYEGRTVYEMGQQGYDDTNVPYVQDSSGRFPANIIAESGVLGDKTRFVDIDAWAKQRFGLEYWKFIDVPKPHKKEKNAGLEGMIEKETPFKPAGAFDDPNGTKKHAKMSNYHPTVKPVKLFLYLLSLGCPPGGTVLDPFVGSGTTCIAALKLGLKSIGIDKTPEYAAIAKARISHAQEEMK